MMEDPTEYVVEDIILLIATLNPLLNGTSVALKIKLKQRKIMLIY